MKVKQYLEDACSKHIFDSLTNSFKEEIRPNVLYLPSRKSVPYQGYRIIIEKFNGTPDPVFHYFYNIKQVPRLESFHMQDNWGNAEYSIFTYKDEQRFYLLRRGLFYYGFVKPYISKTCSLFMEEKYQEIYDLFKTYFKKGFNPEDLETHFPEIPTCRIFDEETYYTQEGTWEAFKCLKGYGFNKKIGPRSCGKKFISERSSY